MTHTHEFTYTHTGMGSRFIYKYAACSCGEVQVTRLKYSGCIDGDMDAQDSKWGKYKV